MDLEEDVKKDEDVNSLEEGSGDPSSQKLEINNTADAFTTKKDPSPQAPG